MDPREDRRRPDRHLVAIRLLRRIAILALVISAVLWVVPKVLTEVGVLGPGPEEYLESAERALAVARTYGAAPLPDYKKAEQERDRARELVRAGKRRESRQAAEQAMALAAEAQKQALVRRASTQQQAEVVYNDLDRQVNDLEKLYNVVTPGMEKEQVGELLTLMKFTRQSAGTVFLAYENKDWDTVLKGEPHAREVIASTRQKLESARR
ncbi:MAG: hypothetical protein DMF78_24095 [Acidobacteria bacterium]|nr:MAG: hypothetical protein DMF78_24095 [Acidobacteriota bacterium]